MKNGKLELFDDVIFNDGMEKGQIRYIDPNINPNNDSFRFFVAFADGEYGWCAHEQLTYIPKKSVMVYVSDRSEEDAIKNNMRFEYLLDRGEEYVYRHVVAIGDGSTSSWEYAVPVDQVPEPKPTITKAELQAIQDTIEKIKSGAILVEGD